MSKVRFGIYTLSVYHPPSKQVLRINEIGRGRTLYEVARDALRARMTTALVKERLDGTGKATQFSSLKCSDSKRVMYGVGRHGSFGQGSVLLHVRTTATTRRAPEQADLLPHYFYLDCSGDSKQAILLVQVVGRSSLKAAIYELIRDALKDVDETLQLKCDGCIPGDVLKELAREGTVKTIEVVKKDVPQDRVDQAVQERQTGTLKLQFTVKNGIGRQWKQRLGLGDGNAAAVFIPGDGLKEFDEWDTIKVHVKVGRSSKTVDLGMLGDPQPFMFPDQTKIEYGADGNPLAKSIHPLAKAEVEDIRRLLDQLE